MKADKLHNVLEHLSHSQLYKDYESAFGEATGLPLALSPVEDWHLAHRGSLHENPFCALLAKQNKTCAACLQVQHELTGTAQDQPRTVTCFAGLRETAVPLRVGEHLIGYLRTGQALSHPPAPIEFSRVVKRLEKLGMTVNTEELREAYFKSRVFSPRRYDSVLHLLHVFAQHLSMVVNEVVFESENVQPPGIARARDFISVHHAEELSLSVVAHEAHMSVFYFCKQFKKATGLSFTDYLGRVRIERAKERLLNPNARVSEVAYEVGFQSLTHFNRVFKKLNGESPKVYRTHLPLANAA